MEPYIVQVPVNLMADEKHIENAKTIARGEAFYILATRYIHSGAQYRITTSERLEPEPSYGRPAHTLWFVVRADPL